MFNLLYYSNYGFLFHATCFSFMFHALDHLLWNHLICFNCYLDLLVSYFCVDAVAVLHVTDAVNKDDNALVLL
jgi:hypothetical protein